jgi:hypothetical protein
MAVTSSNPGAYDASVNDLIANISKTPLVLWAVICFIMAKFTGIMAIVCLVVGVPHPWVLLVMHGVLIALSVTFGVMQAQRDARAT